MARWRRAFRREWQERALALGIDLEAVHRAWQIKLMGHKKAYDLNDRLGKDAAVKKRKRDIAREQRRARDVRRREQDPPT